MRVGCVQECVPTQLSALSGISDVGGPTARRRWSVMCDDATSVSACLSEAESNQLLTAVDRQLAVGRLRADPTESRLSVVLEDRSLWTQFHRLTNEMIVTKHGRYAGLTHGSGWVEIFHFWWVGLGCVVSTIACLR